jgi:hypothetical protein
MCKILTLSNTALVKNQDKMVSTAARLLSAYEKDGFGYAIQGEKGVFGERSLNPKTFKSAFGQKPFNAPFVIETSNTYGKKSKAIGAAIFHGRTSTNERTLKNTHPIVKRDWHLIHNGVVTNHGPAYEMLTTNDTEHLVEHLSTTGISGIAEHLTGYYAVSAIAPDGNLHIIRDSTASLYAAQIDEIESFIFATNESLIRDFCKAMKYKASQIKKFADDTYIILQKLDIISCEKFTPRGSSFAETRYSSLSLGREIESGSRDESAELLSMTKSFESSERYLTDEDYFLREVNYYGDDTWIFKTFNGEPMTFDEFANLKDSEKLDCIVIRPDGSTCSPYDYQCANSAGLIA